MTFEKQKTLALTKVDKSKKGKIDSKIKPLVDIINAQENYYTTSSCAGRITLLTEDEKKGKTLFKSHDQVTAAQITPYLKTTETIWFRQEPMILHVACQDTRSSESLLTFAQNNGFKRAGIISPKKNLVEIKSNELINTPITGSNFIIDSNHLNHLIIEANKKLNKNKKKINHLVASFKMRNKINKNTTTLSKTSITM